MPTEWLILCKNCNDSSLYFTTWNFIHSWYVLEKICFTECLPSVVAQCFHLLQQPPKIPTCFLSAYYSFYCLGFCDSRMSQNHWQTSWVGYGIFSNTVCFFSFLPCWHCFYQLCNAEVEFKFNMSVNSLKESITPLSEHLSAQTRNHRDQPRQSEIHCVECNSLL